MFRFPRSQNITPDVRDTASAPSRRLRLLVVEENPTALSVIGRRLAHMGHDVVLAQNGFAGLSFLNAQRFDLIILDMGMTALSGVDTLRKMQASGMMVGASTLMITGRSDPSAIVEALEAGADDQIVKPFDFEVLDARIRHVVSRAQRIADLKRHNETLDARIARRAVELGEARNQLEELTADRTRIAQSIQMLTEQLAQLNAARAQV